MVSTKVVTLRVDDTLRSRVDAVAKELGHSRAWVIHKALDDYLEDVEDTEITRQRMADPEDAVVPLDEAMTQL